MATWPAYAHILAAGFSEQRESALLRTEMESGPTRQAKIKSRVLIQRNIIISLHSAADYASFKTWFSATINEGADWFDWTDPVDSVSKSARFVGGGFTASSPTGLLTSWHIPASIETWSA